MKISKKIFACVLTVCMLLTMFAGVLSASAAVAGSATIGSAEINVGEAAEVTVTLNADAAIGGADLYIAFPEEAAVSAAVATEGYSLEYSVAGEMAAEGNVDLVEGVAHFILLASDDAFAGATTVEIVLTVAGLAEGEYAVAFADGTLIGTTGEVVVDAALTNGAITVIAECAHAETKDVVTEAATCGKAGTKNIVCALCDEVITEGVEIPATGEHTYEEGVCGVCGAEDPNYEPPVTGPVLDEAIVFNGEKVQISSTLNAYVRVNKALVEKYAAAEVVFTPTLYSQGNEVVGADVVVNLFDESIDTSKNWLAYYYNFGMYTFGLKLEAYVRCYDAQGNYVAYSEKEEYTAAQLLKDQFANVEYSAATDAQKKLNAALTDLLNMGAKAQVYFAEQNPGSDLANTVKNGDLVNAWLSEGVAFPQTFATTELGELSTVNETVYKDGYDENTESKVSLSVNLTGAPAIQFKYSRVDATFPDPSKLSLTVSYTKLLGGEEVITDTVEGADAWAALKVGKSYVYIFSDCALYDGNKTVTATLTYDGAVFATTQYSVESYINENKADTTSFGDLARQIGLFNMSARVYFGTN